MRKTVKSAVKSEVCVCVREAVKVKYEIKTVLVCQ